MKSGRAHWHFPHAGPDALPTVLLDPEHSCRKSWRARTVVYVFVFCFSLLVDHWAGICTVFLTLWIRVGFCMEATEATRALQPFEDLPKQQDITEERKEAMQEGRQAGTQEGRNAGRQEGREAGR